MADSQKFIPLMVPDIRDEDILEVEKVLRSGMLVQGERVRVLENEFAKYSGTKHAVAVSNGTASMHIALKSLGVGLGDEVIVPAFSYIATANVVELVGATPVFVDVDLDTFNIDVNQIESKITNKTRAILPVHEFGLPCDIEEVVRIAKKYGLYVIEDAACGLGSKYKDQHVGSFGVCGSFSFHPRKAITGGEGGMLVTNDSDLAEKFRTLRNHGISNINGINQFVEAGFNYRLTDIQAALIASQFKRIDKILYDKNKLAKIYNYELKSFDKIILPVIPPLNIHSWQTMHIILSKNIDRDQIKQRLYSKGVESNYGAQCIPYQQYYTSKYKLDCKELFPNSLFAFNHGLALPLYERLNKKQVLNICRLIKNCILNETSINRGNSQI